MRRFGKQAYLVILLVAAGAAAQTTVTNNNDGAAGAVPVYTGSATLGNSPISISGSNVGIGTTAPNAPLTVVSNTSSSNIILGEFLDSSIPNAGLVQIQFGQSQALNADGTLIFAYNSTTPALSYTSLGTYGNSFTLNVNGAGNVGIGTTNPGAKLEVNGNVLLTAGSGASMTYPDGTVQSTAWNGVLSGGDYAESVNVSGGRDEYEPGDVLVIDPASEGRFLKSSAPYSTAVTGIYSTRPGVVGRRQRTARAHMDEEVPMAMTGIVPTKVSAENGPIKPGDLLVTSSRPGYAMRGTDRTQMLGAVIGKAIGHLDSGVGVIEAVVTLQ